MKTIHLEIDREMKDNADSGLEHSGNFINGQPEYYDTLEEEEELNENLYDYTE